MTVCNMTIEGGARAGLIIAPDEKDLRIYQGQAARAEGRSAGKGIEYWKTLHTDERRALRQGRRARRRRPAADRLWGSSPEDVVSVEGIVPNPDDIHDENKRTSKWRALDYMGLKPGTKITDIAIDRVFIGS